MRDVEVLDAVANLDRVSEAALQYLAIDDLLRHVLRRVRRMFNADAGAILLMTEDGRFLTVRAAHGLEADESEGTVPIGTGIAGQIAEGRKPVVLHQVADGGAAVPTGKIRSLLGAPLIADDRLVGIVHVGTHQPRRFTEDEARLLELVADRVALGVDRARRYEDEQRARIDAEAGSRAAEAAGKARDEFLAILSHELRTPLTPIVGWARLLKGGVADGVAVRRAAESIERNALFLSRLIDDLLDVPRMMQTGLSLHVERIDPAAPVRAAVESLRAAAEEKGVALGLTLAGPPGPLTADPDRLQQVVRNLLSNAVKFTPSGGRIGVELARVGDAVEIRVIDTGQGIGADFLPHIFDRFSQEDCATPARTGLGLGLAIVQHIVERHGGTVRADSAGRGRGATFTVRLPVR
jgi:signal transduction histidine kinase